MIQAKVRKKKICFNVHAEGTKLDSPVYSKQTNKMRFLKSLVMSKCESRTSLYAVKYK